MHYANIEVCVWAAPHSWRRSRSLYIDVGKMLLLYFVCMRFLQECMLLLTSSGSPADDINPGTTTVVRFSSGSSVGRNVALKQRDVSISYSFLC